MKLRKMKRVYRVSFNVSNERVIRVLEEIPKGKKTQFITKFILERLERMEWYRSKGKGTVGEAYSYDITDKRVIEILEQIPKGERTQFVTNCILSCMYLAKQRAKERAEHKEVRIKVE